MDVIQMFMNIVFCPVAFFILLLFLPPYLFFKFLLSIFRCVFHENLAGKVVLITGASSGIGEQLTYEYAKRGAIMVLVARRIKALQEVAVKARGYGSPDVLVVQADVSNIDECKRFIDEALDHFGRLDHLVIGAGVATASIFEDFTNINNIRPLMDTNFWGSIYPTSFAIPHLRKSKGKIVVIASVCRWLPLARMGFYCASKAAVSMFYETLRIELGHDVGMTIVNPGLIESELTKGKVLNKDGKMEVDQELRDITLGPIPVSYVQMRAKTIVNSVCAGDRYVTTPGWYKALQWWQTLCPDVVEWLMRLVYIPPRGAPAKEALSKKILDATGAKYFLYPPSILSPAIKPA